MTPYAPATSGYLIAEHQAHGMLVSESDDLPVEYAWDVSTLPQGDNRARLSRMKYPNWPGGNERRVLDFGYGGTGSLDDRLSRVASLTDSTQTSGVGLVASYTYSGRGRHTGTTLGNGIGQTVQTTADTLDGLDRHGRLRDLHFTDDQEATVHRVRHGYDAAGHRAWSRVTHAGGGTGPAVDNTRSMLYAHDALGRLAEARMGSLRAGHTALQDGTDAGDDPDPPTPRELAWSLDRLGNRTGDSSSPGQSLIESYDSAGAPITPVLLETTHDVDLRNRLIDEIRSEDGVPVAGAFDRPFIYDGAGNLVADPEFVFVYDGFNRLVQVYERGTIDVDEFDDVTGEPDGWLVHFSYDGLGRLIRRQAKWPPSQHTGDQDLRVEHYYYDGARRIQEVFHDPVEAVGPNPQPKPPDWEPSAETRTEREHIHAAHDGAGPDHLHLQVDWFDRQIWVLHDQSGTPLALTTDTGRVFEQYAWDPYGNLVLRDRYIPLGINDPYYNVRSRVGHQGLFFDRLDEAVTAAQLVPGARGNYQNRNRVYDPQRGRYLQSDPFATGVILQSVDVRRAVITMPGGHRQSFRIKEHYGNGLSTYAYLGSSPLMWTDPSGLHIGFDPNTHWLDPTLYRDGGPSPFARSSQRPPRQNNRLGSATNALAFTGSAMGAMYAAWYWGDGFAGNTALANTIGDQARRHLIPFGGGLMGGLFGSAGAVGGEIAGIGVGWGASGFATDGFAIASNVIAVAGAAGAPGLNAVISTSSAWGLAAPAVLGAAFYSGMLEYMAESIWDW